MPQKHLSRTVRKAQKTAYKLAMRAYLTALAAGQPATPPAKTWLKASPIAGTRS